MKDVRELLEGNPATKEILEQEGYRWFGYHLDDPIYANEHNKIVVRDGIVRMVYKQNKGQMGLGL